MFLSNFQDSAMKFIWYVNDKEKLSLVCRNGDDDAEILDACQKIGVKLNL